jgi:hypothetical protein
VFSSVSVVNFLSRSSVKIFFHIFFQTHFAELRSERVVLDDLDKKREFIEGVFVEELYQRQPDLKQSERNASDLFSGGGRRLNDLVDLPAAQNFLSAGFDYDVGLIERIDANLGQIAFIDRICAAVPRSDVDQPSFLRHFDQIDKRAEDRRRLDDRIIQIGIDQFFAEVLMNLEIRETRICFRAERRNIHELVDFRGDRLAQNIIVRFKIKWIKSGGESRKRGKDSI